MSTRHHDQELEQEYRRGYRDGFIEAVNAMRDSKQKDRLFDFWEGPLSEWQSGDCTKMELPPAAPD